MTCEEFKEFLEKNRIKLDFDWPIDLHEIGCTYTLDEGKLLYDDVLIDPQAHMSNSKDVMGHYLHAIKAQGKIDEIHEDLVTILHGDLPDLDDYKICEVESSNGSNDPDITIDEFKEFLEKNRLDIYISHCRDIGILTGKFYIDYNHFLAVYEVESVFHSIYGCEHDEICDIFIYLLAKKENLKDVRDVILSAMKDDDYEICEVETSNDSNDSNGSREIEGTLEEAEIIGTKETSIREQTLDTAKKCVMGDREQDYGTPESNFATIASFWSDYLDMDISAQQVADMMILMKISRIKNGGGTGDRYVDIAGYAACGNEILSKRG